MAFVVIKSLRQFYQLITANRTIYKKEKGKFIASVIGTTTSIFQVKEFFAIRKYYFKKEIKK